MKTTISEYFQRQALVPEVEAKGLEKLRRAKIAVVGVGGVGAATADYLARSGIGFLRLIDQDIVEPSNLHRLPGVEEKYLYYPKAEVIAETLARTSPWVSLEPVVDTITLKNADELLDGVDLIADGLDNFRTRYYLNHQSREKRIPYIFTSAIAAQGHVGVFAPPETPCLECAFPEVIDRTEDSCETLGILASAAGLVAAAAAGEALKVLIGLPTLLKGQLLTIDMMGPDFLVSSVKRRDLCETCNSTKRIESVPSGILTTLCGEKTFNITPSVPRNLDLLRISQSIPSEAILTETKSVLVYRKGGFTVSLFKTGRLLLKGVDGERAALSAANEIWNQVSTEKLVLQGIA